MEKLIAFDKRLFLFLNRLHTPWLDPVMYMMSERYVWIPLYVFLLLLIVKNYNTGSWLVILSITLTLVLSDQIASGLLKPFIMRLRPSHEPDLQAAIHLVNDYKGGLYGFASSHAANVFGMAMFFWLLFRGRYKSVFWLFAWAAGVSYTRIYLGVHYPGDIVAGGIIGIFSGWTGFRIFRWSHALVRKEKYTN